VILPGNRELKLLQKSSITCCGGFLGRGRGGGGPIRGRSKGPLLSPLLRRTLVLRSEFGGEGEREIMIERGMFESDADGADSDEAEAE